MTAPALSLYEKRIGPPLPRLRHSSFHPVPHGHCSKLKLNIVLDSSVFCAGQVVSGHLELDCITSKHVLLGQVGLELEGYETLEEKDVTYRQVFLSTHIIFQGPRKPPSQAVHGPAIDGFWKALKRTTLFPFSFQLPHDLPSSYTFQDIASLTYTLKGWVQFQYKGKIGTMTHSRDAWVIEKVSDVQASTAKWGMNEGRPLFTQEGLVKLYIGVPQSRIQTGDELLVNVHIKNETAKKIQGIRLKLVKKLLILETDQSIRIITENVRQMEYKGQETTFPPMTDKNLTLTLHVPTSVWTVRKTSLVEVSCNIIASIDLGFLSKQVQVDIPIEVYHPSSLKHSTEIFIPSEPQRKFPTLREARASLRRMRNFLGKQGRRMLPWEDPHDIQTPLAYQAPIEDQQFFMNGMFYISAPQRTLRMARSTQKLKEIAHMQSNVPRHLGYLCEPGLDKTLPSIHPTLRDIPKRNSSHRHMKKTPIQEVYARMIRECDAERTIVASSSKDLPGLPVSTSTDHCKPSLYSPLDIRQLQSTKK